MDKAPSSGRNRRIARVQTESGLQSGYLSEEESVYGASGDSTSGEEYVDIHAAPSRELLAILAPEESNYQRGGISRCRCVLSTLREFHRPRRVRIHVEIYRRDRDRWRASGKHLKLRASLYDNDMVTNDSVFTDRPNI